MNHIISPYYAAEIVPNKYFDSVPEYARDELDAAVKVLVESEFGSLVHQIWFFDGRPYREGVYPQEEADERFDIAAVFQPGDVFSSFKESLIDEEGRPVKRKDSLQYRRVLNLVEGGRKLKVFILTTDDIARVRDREVLPEYPDLCDHINGFVNAVESGYLLYTVDED